MGSDSSVARRPGLTWRVLPPDEWSRVAHWEPFASGGLPDPQFWRIVVVERDGVIIGMSSLFTTVHWDMFHIEEADRGNPAVFRAMLAAGLGVMAQHHVDQVHTTVPHTRPELGDMLEHFGFERAPGDLFLFTRRH